MTKYRFFESFGEIDSAYFLAVDAFLEKADKKVIRFTRRQVFSAALIAAVLVSLLTITAYAADLFGLQSRLIRRISPSTQTHSLPAKAEKALDELRNVYYRDYISLSGVTGSTEYQAAAEWLAFKGSYAEQMAAEQLAKGEEYYEWRDLERSFAPDEEVKEICRLYQVWDSAMRARLQEIAEKYGLQLHTSRSPLFGDTREHGIYEDGSFVVTIANYGEPIVFYNVYAERHGTLPADDLVAVGIEQYKEWEYQNAYGNTLSIAVKEDVRDETWSENTVLIFYSSHEGSITIKTNISQQAGECTNIIETFADTIDFSAVEAANKADEIIAILKGDKT